MTPAAQKFYNLLLAHYLNDSTIISKVRKYLTARIMAYRKGIVYNYGVTLVLEGLDSDLISIFHSLSDEELSLAIKTFDMRMTPKTMPAETKDGVTQIKLQPWEESIINNGIANKLAKDIINGINKGLSEGKS